MNWKRVVVSGVALVALILWTVTVAAFCWSAWPREETVTETVSIEGHLLSDMSIARGGGQNCSYDESNRLRAASYLGTLILQPVGDAVEYVDYAGGEDIICLDRAKKWVSPRTSNQYDLESLQEVVEGDGEILVTVTLRRKTDIVIIYLCYFGAWAVVCVVIGWAYLRLLR